MASYQQALSLLQQASTPTGFAMSAAVDGNTPTIATRDAVLAGLAAVLSGESDLVETFGHSLETIWARQHQHGFMPGKITGNEVSYNGNVDDTLWAIIGLCVYCRVTKNQPFAKALSHKVERCVALMDAWEYNGNHLVYVPLGGSWAAEYIGHGYLLTSQLLRVWALEEAAIVFGRENWATKAGAIRTVVGSNFWTNNNTDQLYPGHLRDFAGDPSPRYWQMGFNQARLYPYFDQLGNALALLLRMGGQQNMDTVASYHEELLRKSGGMLPCFAPEITLQDDDMRTLSNSYVDRFRNYPGQFHNGGLWPSWNGFAVAALHKAGRNYAALFLQDRLEQACGAGDAGFNECLDAVTSFPGGISLSIASAAGLVIGKKALDGKYIV